MVDQRDVGQQRPRMGSVKDYWPTIEQLADAPDDEVSEFMAKKNKNDIVLLCKQLLASYKKSHQSIENNLVDIKKSVDEMKTAISPTANTEAKYSDITKNSYVPESNALASEIRVSGIPEYKSLSSDRNRKLDIFDHEEVSVHKVLSHLSVNSSDIVSMSTLGKLNAANWVGSLVSNAWGRKTNLCLGSTNNFLERSTGIGSNRIFRLGLG